LYAEYAEPHEGVPEWLRPSLWDWLEKRLNVSDYALLRVVREMERRLRVDFEVEEYFVSVSGAVRSKVERDPGLFLDVVDYSLRLKDLPRPDTRTLRRILDEAGSAWTVIDAGAGLHLSRRVSKTTCDRFESAVSHASRASKHLREAWVATFGRHPNGQTGYDEAVKAVECVAQPVLSPKNAKATLGTMIADIRNKPNKWQLLLNHPNKEAQMLSVADAMEILWKGQYRHGTADPGAPSHNTLEDAQAAIQLAITLVEWFRSGTVSAT
jgi:hypothetical protein